MRAERGRRSAAPAAAAGGRQRGLTLLELLVALAIFALLGAAGYGALRGVLDARAAVAATTDRLHALQLAWTLLERDLEQAVARPVRDEFGVLRPALTTSGGDLLRLTRAGWDNPLAQPRATLQRLALRLRAADGVLERRYWPVLDRARDRPRALDLLDGVDAVDLRLLDRDGRWLTRWPPPGVDAERAARLLPRAVELRLRLRDWGDIARLFVLADGV